MSQATDRPTTIPTRRALLAGPAVAAAALAGGTVANAIAIAIAEAKAAEIDPIYSAIKRERDAYAVYRATEELNDDTATEHAHVGACNAWWSSQEVLMRTQPTTLAGLLALLNHVDAHCDPDEGWIDEWAELGFPTLAAAVRNLVDGGAQS